MTCMRCGRAYEPNAPFCAACGLPAAASKTRARVTTVTAIVALGAAIVMQVCALMPWVTVALPLSDGQQAAFSVYEAHRFVTAIGNVIGGAAMLATIERRVRLMLIVLQTAILATAGIGAASPFLKKPRAVVWGCASSLTAAAVAFAAIRSVGSLPTVIKNAAVLNAVTIDAAPFVLIAAAGAAFAAMTIQIVVRANKRNGKDDA